MPRIYSQARKDPNMTVIADNLPPQACREVIVTYAAQWVHSKAGRKARPMGELEMGFYFSDGKLACLMWIDTVPAPVGENKFAPASGEVPGLSGTK